jgi:hypothetical protein
LYGELPLGKENLSILEAMGRFELGYYHPGCGVLNLGRDRNFPWVKGY